MKNKRPSINDVTTGQELKKWYWLKEELVAYCKLQGISYAGGKFEILERISNILDKKAVTTNKIKTTTSAFDWHSSHLTLTTKITDSYKNTQNVRRFFTSKCGDQFHFSISFMAWMKKHVGKNLNAAVAEWKRLNKQQKDKNFKSIIPPHNQYNRYVRDFFGDNPNASLNDARTCWKLKRSLPLQFHKYEKTDLQLK